MGTVTRTGSLSAATYAHIDEQNPDPLLTPEERFKLTKAQREQRRQENLARQSQDRGRIEQKARGWSKKRRDAQNQYFARQNLKNIRVEVEKAEQARQKVAEGGADLSDVDEFLPLAVKIDDFLLVKGKELLMKHVAEAQSRLEKWQDDPDVTIIGRMLTALQDAKQEITALKHANRILHDKAYPE